MNKIKVLNIISLKFFLAFFVLIVTLTGCIGPLESDIDVAFDKAGEPIILDTEKNRKRWVQFINYDVNRELMYEIPGAGYKTWNERWLASINALKKGNQENYQKYIDYIIDTRKTVGLLDLVFP